jgi:hypothetical protein
MLWPFPQDAPGTAATPFGTVHIVLALLSALTLVIATFLSAFAWKGVPGWQSLRWYSVVTGILILVTGALGSAALAGGWPAFGLYERMTQVSFLAWFAVIGVTALRRKVPGS